LLQPYLTIIVYGRNDDYGGVKYFRKKHEAFIKFYAKYLDKGIDFLEIVVVDYNQVVNKKPYFDQFNWNRFKKVKNVVITNADHKRLTNESKYPFHGNIAFNEGLRVASGKFVLALTIDVFLSMTLIRHLLKKNLNDNYFYRTDLYYFKQKYFRIMFLQRLWNRLTIQRIARRHSSSKEGKLDVELESWYQKFIKIPNSFVNQNEINSIEFFLTRDWPSPPDTGEHVNEWLEDSGLHTNASGDFILAARIKWLVINGFSEDSTWNLHCDSMVLGEFYALGMKQALFTNPLIALHALHERSGGVGHNQISWSNWCNIFSEVLCGKRSLQKRTII